MGPLQLVASPSGKGLAGTGSASVETISVMLEEGEVRPVTDAELEAIAQLLPQERDYAQLADIQRAATLKRGGGKTTKSKARGLKGKGGKMFEPECWRLHA